MPRLRQLLNQGSRLELPVVPLREAVVLPKEKAELLIGRTPSCKALHEAKQGRGLVFTVCQRKKNLNKPLEKDLFTIGTVCHIISVEEQHGGPSRVILQGLRRARIQECEESAATVRLLSPVTLPDPGELNGWLKALEKQIMGMIKKRSGFQSREFAAAFQSKNPELLFQLLYTGSSLNTMQQQQILEMNSLETRIAFMLTQLRSTPGNDAMKSATEEKVRIRLENTQKEFFLHEQLKEVRKALGKEGDEQSLIDELKLRAAEENLPPHAARRFDRELQRLKTIPQFSPEAGILNGYLDWLLELPWHTSKDDEKNIKIIQRDLNTTHFGLDEVKKTILEYVAVNILAGDEGGGSILCLTGPPGTGKTTLAMSIASALKRDFVRMSLGGLHDEAEIRGHRRTYIGAMPGRIIQNLRKAGSRNPVFLLDEIDKMGQDHRGDPASALLEVLDPEINDSFQDNYLELEYDLSRVLFITTANAIHTVPEPLRDRMEVVHISGYTRDEKMEIGHRFLFPRQKTRAGLKKNRLILPKALIGYIIDNYTREAGVRKLEQMLRKICRNRAFQILAEPETGNIKIDTALLEEMFGQPRYKQNRQSRKSSVGLAHGLAWTETGGQLLDVETRSLPGSGKISLTGKLGDVMRESAHAALSHIRSVCIKWKPNFDFGSRDFHIHVPEGAIPKDGPSAGITIASALLSAITEQPLLSTFAMTGEISLLGNVLPVGGLKEKILAARRFGVKRIILPEQNQRDVEALQPGVRRGVSFSYVATMDDVIKLVLPKL